MCRQVTDEFLIFAFFLSQLSSANECRCESATLLSTEGVWSPTLAPPSPYIQDRVLGVPTQVPSPRVSCRSLPGPAPPTRTCTPQPDYTVYTKPSTHVARMGSKIAQSFFTSENLRQELQSAYLSFPVSEEGCPAEVDNYHSLCLLEPIDKTPPEQVMCVSVCMCECVCVCVCVCICV